MPCRSTGRTRLGCAIDDLTQPPRDIILDVSERRQLQVTSEVLPREIGVDTNGGLLAFIWLHGSHL